MITWGPMFARDQERIDNLNYIYNNNEVEAAQMLWMGRASFYELVKRFREGRLLRDNIHTSVEEQFPCFFMF